MPRGGAGCRPTRPLQGYEAEDPSRAFHPLPIRQGEVTATGEAVLCACVRVSTDEFPRASARANGGQSRGKEAR